MKHLKYFSPSIVWVLACLTYFNYAVGLDNFFAQLPYEVFISMFSVACIPVLNILWYMLDKKTNLRNERLRERHHKSLTKSHTLANDMDENTKTIPEVLAEVKPAEKSIEVESLWDGVNKWIFPSKTA